MKRRVFMATAGSLFLSGCSQISANDSGSQPALSIDSERVYETREWVEHKEVRIKTTRIRRFDTAEYNDTEAATIKTWNPGEDKSIVIASYWVENLSKKELDWPVWENFHLVTPEGTVEPLSEIPGGTSLEQLEDPTAHWTHSKGVRADYGYGWDGVFVAPTTDVENYATKWVRPEGSIYWRL